MAALLNRHFVEKEAGLHTALYGRLVIAAFVLTAVTVLFDYSEQMSETSKNRMSKQISKYSLKCLLNK